MFKFLKTIKDLKLRVEKLEALTEDKNQEEAEPMYFGKAIERK